MYPSIFNSFPFIRTASAKSRHFHVPQPTFLFPVETPLRLSRNMLTNCPAACAHLSITVSEISEIFVKNRQFFIHPCIRRPGWFPSEYRHPLWYGKTRMASLPDGEKVSKISLFVLAQLWNVTDRQTDGHRVTAYTALIHMHRAVKTLKHLKQQKLLGLF